MRKSASLCIILVMGVTHTQSDDELVTVSEAARISFLSIDTIRRYADKGILPVSRTPTNHRRFRRSDVEALITGSTASTVPAVDAAAASPSAAAAPADPGTPATTTPHSAGAPATPEVAP